MKRPILAVLLLVVLTTGVAADPVIKVDNAIYRVSIQSESSVAHTFVLSNAGDHLLVISDVVPSCGCTTATLETYELGPGSSVELPIVIDTAGFSGLVTRTVDILSNDPATPNLALTLHIEAPELPAGPRKLSQSDFLHSIYALVDVRTQEEYDAGHLFGAVNIPLSEIQENLDAWAPHLPTDIPLIVYCKRGARSASAAQILFDAGFVNVIDLLGGTDEWVETYGEGYLFETF